jgi:hypothetical protein
MVYIQNYQKQVGSELQDENAYTKTHSIFIK